MAGGRRYKWQGSQIEVGVDWSAESPGLTITGVSQANPAVVAATNTLTDGAVVRIREVVGMTELNEEVFIAITPTAANFALRGVDSTQYAAWVSGGVVDVLTMVPACELTNYNRQGGTAPEIPAETICSDAAEYEIGLRDFGSAQLEYNFAPVTAFQEALEEFADSGDKTAVRVTLPKQGGRRTLLGFVQQTSEQSGNGAIWKGQATFRVTGRPYDQAGA